MQNINTLIGHSLGFISVALFFYSYQRTQKRKIMIIQTVATALSCVQYLLIGAFSGFALNVVCIIRNFIIFRKDLKIFSYGFWPYALAALMGVMGAVSWQGPMSLLIIVALVANTLFLYFPNVQNLRKSIVITSTMVLIYNAYFSVWGGVFNEMIAISSVIIGIYRYRKVK